MATTEKEVKTLEEIKSENQIFVIIDEKDDKGNNTVIYADEVNCSGMFDDWVCIEHHTKEGIKCQTDLPKARVLKIYEKNVK